jgi:hypothetical protein
MTGSPRLLASRLLAVWTAVTAALTLSPSRYTPPLTLETFLCVGCGWFGTADVIANWLLFLPGGALAGVILGGRRAVLAAVCLTSVIEILQVGIPGRAPALQDLIANTLGAVCGVLLVRFGLGRRARNALAALAVVVWLAPLALSVPIASSADLYGQWTPAFAELEKYEGEVLAAAVGGLPVRSGRLQGLSGLDTAIVERRPIELSLEVGPRPSTPALIFQVVDSRRVALVSLGAVGEDLTVRADSPARLLRLPQPAIRWRGAMREVAAGDTVSVVIDRSRSSACVSVGPRTACRLAPSLGDGWGHLVVLEGAPTWLAALLTFGWCLGLGVAVGATSSGARAAAIRGLALAAVGLLGCVWSPDVRPDVVHATTLAAGSLLGFGLRSPIARLWTFVRVG